VPNWGGKNEEREGEGKKIRHRLLVALLAGWKPSMRKGGGTAPSNLEKKVKGGNHFIVSAGETLELKGQMRKKGGGGVVGKRVSWTTRMTVQEDVKGGGGRGG